MSIFMPTINHVTGIPCGPMSCSIVFIISNEPEISDALTAIVASAGLCTRTLSSLEACLEALGDTPDCCLILNMGTDKHPQSWWNNFISACSKIPVLVLTEHGDIATAVNAIKLGALDVIQKPLQHGSILERIKLTLTAKI